MQSLLYLIPIIAILFAGLAASQDPSQNASVCTLFKTAARCRVNTWYEELLDDQQLNRKLLTSLRVDIRNSSFTLTKKHLKDLNSLESLTIRGICKTEKKKKIEYCRTPTGVTDIDDDAFEATPSLIGLTMIVQPLSSLNSLRQLKKLRFLKLKWFRSLKTLDPSVLDGCRSTIERLIFSFAPITLLSSNFAKNMNNLRIFELKTAFNLRIQTGALSNLPKLESLYIAFYTRRSTVFLEENSLSNVPNLRDVALYLVNEINSTSPCSGVFNVMSLNLVSSNVSLFDHCPQLLYCEKCGRNSSLYPQSVVLRRPISKGKELTTLPTADLIPTFNISNLYIYHSPYPYPFEMLPQMPLLKVLVIEDYLKAPGQTRIKRFRDNPFIALPDSVRLDKVRITLTNCDCQLLDIIDWMETNQRYDGNKSIDDVFKIDCLQVDGVCSDIDEKPRYFIKWMNLTLITEKLTSVCNSEYPDNSAVYSSASECRCLNLESCTSHKVLQGSPVLTFFLCALFFMVNRF